MPDQPHHQPILTGAHPLTVGQCGTLACLLEATAPKAGNVHRGADFEDLTFTDFAVSAVLLGPMLEQTEAIGVGRTVWATIQATRHYVTTNTNLGIILLLAPMAAVPREQRLAAGIGRVLDELDAEDARWIYHSIANAGSGSLGKVESMDIRGPAPPVLLTAMAAAADRDLVARQYVTQFETVLQKVAVWLVEGRDRGWSTTTAILHAHLRLLSEEPDSLIARKCGKRVAEEAAVRAGAVLDSGGPDEEPFLRALREFDFWLRCDGHRRNPGTSADLIAAGLFAALREGQLAPPWR